MRVSGCGRLRGMGGELGQSMIEMAIAMPLFLAVVFGIIQTSMVMQAYCSATYACRNAARYAALHSTASLAPITPSGVQTMVQSGLFLGGAAVSPTITVQYSTGPFLLGTTPTFTSSSSNNIIGNLVLVKVTWNQTISTPFMRPVSFSVGTQTTKLISR